MSLLRDEGWADEWVREKKGKSEMNEKRIKIFRK